MTRLRYLVYTLIFILLSGVTVGDMGSSAYGQSRAEYVSIRVDVEKGQEGVPVNLIHDGDVLVDKETNEDGIADFVNLDQGKYIVKVPQRSFRQTVEITSSVTEVVTVPFSEQDGTTVAGGGETRTRTAKRADTEGWMTYLLYGTFVVLIAAMLGLVYFLVRRMKGGSLNLQLTNRGTSSRTRSTEAAERTNDRRSQTRNRETPSEEEAVIDRRSAKSDQPVSTEDRMQGAGATSNPSSDPVSEPEDSDGSTFEKYENQKRLGSGGMSTVWLAKDDEGRDVALKIMSENMLDDEDLVRKFVQEGKALDRINSTHPNAPVVQVYDYGRFDGESRPYLALEYLQGESLEVVIDPSDPMSVEQALPVIKQIAMALSAAHANGVYHRDVKPENVIVVDRSSIVEVKLIDFGVARHEYLSYVTMDGSLMGTPPYMSPEQGSSGKVDERSDIYSLGALSYALLAGEPPFVDDNPLAVLEMHQEAPVPSLPDRVHSSVAELIFWMLEKDPQDRPSKMWQVVGRIDELIVSTPEDS